MTRIHDITVDPDSGHFRHWVTLRREGGLSVARFQLGRGQMVNAVAILATMLTLAARIPTDIIVLDVNLGAESERKLGGFLTFLLDALSLLGKPIALIGDHDALTRMIVTWNFDGFVAICRSFDDITRLLF